METPMTKDVKTLVQPDKIDNLQHNWLLSNYPLWKKVFEFKNETARLKEAAFNRGNKVNQENYAKEKLSNFSLQRENAFVKTELNNKQHIIEKLLNINSNQPKKMVWRSKILMSMNYYYYYYYYYYHYYYYY